MSNKNKPTPAQTNNDDAPEATLVAGKDVGVTPNGVKFAAANPGEKMPSFVPGKNWEPGQTLTGTYVRTERVYSDKLTAGKKDAQGKIYRDLHVLEDISKKTMFAIWSVGILGNFFDQVEVGAPVSITYKGLADQAFKPGQSVPHAFDFALGEGYRLQPRRNAAPEAPMHQ